MWAAKPKIFRRKVASPAGTEGSTRKPWAESMEGFSEEVMGRDTKDAWMLGFWSSPCPDSSSP